MAWHFSFFGILPQKKEIEAFGTDNQGLDYSHNSGYGSYCKEGIST